MSLEFREFREKHVIRFLSMYGPCTEAYLKRAIPGNIGGDAVLVARRLIESGRLDASLILEDAE